jgi:hypothetical protein
MRNIQEFWILVTAAVFVNAGFALLLFVFTTDEEFEFTKPPKHENALERFFTLFYFSVSTFTTVGYGDIAPSSAKVRLLVTLYQIFVFGGLVSVLFNL